MMSSLTPKDSHWSFGTFGLFDIALALVEAEAQEWGEDAGADLFLEESLQTVRIEAEKMASVCARRTGERARVFSVVGRWSSALKDLAHYSALAKVADVWLIGVADCELDIPGVIAVPVPRGAQLEKERGVIVESQSFGAAYFAREAGLLNPGDPSTSYYEGVLTVRQEAVEIAAGRMASVLKLAPIQHRWVDHELLANWFGRLNRRFLEALEASRLQLKAREEEIKRIQEEHERLEKMASGFVGGSTWNDVKSTLASGAEEIADRYRASYTICFCDLVGFTKISERYEPSEIAYLLNDHFARLANIVANHGGEIDKFIGDAMLAYFPEPEEAFAAAKKMVQESRSVNLKQGQPFPIQVRVGLNTGEVALATLGVSQYRQRTIIGEAVNFAQRMQSAAPPHSILLSERTFAQLSPALTRSLDPIQVPIKGRRDPVEAYLWTISTDRREEVHGKIAVRTGLMASQQRQTLRERLNQITDKNVK